MKLNPKLPFASLSPNPKRLGAIALLAVLAGTPLHSAWAAASAITAPLASATGLGVWAALSAHQSKSSSHEKKKIILAVAAIEDAAEFYNSGEIKGVLPLILKELRSAHTDQSTLSDEELIDTIVESAEKVLESETQSPETKK